MLNFCSIHSGDINLKHSIFDILGYLVERRPLRYDAWGSSLIGASVLKGDFNTVNYVEPSTPASLESCQPCVFPDGEDERDMAATLDSQRFHIEWIKA